MDKDLQQNLPPERLRRILAAAAQSWGFEIRFPDSAEAPEEGWHLLEIPGFGQPAFIKGPAVQLANMRDMAVRMAEIFGEQERENASLTEEIVERYQQLSLLFDMSDRLGVARDNQGRMKAILQTASEAANARFGLLTLSGQEGATCCIGEEPAVGQGLKDLAGRALSHGRLMLDEREHFVLPLKAGMGKTVGCLALGPKQRGVYRSGDVKILSTLGAYAALLLDSGRLYEDLESLFFSTIRSMIEAVDAKDPSTRGHSERVRRYSHVIGEGLGFEADELKSLELAALLHDVGKIGLPDVILNNEKEYLSESQWEMVRMHPEIGVSILSHVAQLKSILPAIGQHHERFDGQGYPNGIDGENITLFARIIAVADAFDAMTMNRTYRTRFSLDRALAELGQNSGSQFDPQLVSLFIANIKKTEILIDA